MASGQLSNKLLSGQVGSVDGETTSKTALRVQPAAMKRVYTVVGGEGIGNHVRFWRSAAHFLDSLCR